MSVTTSQTPYERLRSIAAAQALRDGRITVPLTCAHCDSSLISHDVYMEGGERVTEDVLNCLTCSRKTPVSTAHEVRRQRIKQIICDGIDLD